MPRHTDSLLLPQSQRPAQIDCVTWLHLTPKLLSQNIPHRWYTPPISSPSNSIVMSRFWCLRLCALADRRPFLRKTGRKEPTDDRCSDFQLAASPMHVCFRAAAEGPPGRCVSARGSDDPSFATHCPVAVAYAYDGRRCFDLSNAVDFLLSQLCIFIESWARV